MLLKDIERALQEQKLINKVVYDLDQSNDAASNSEHSNLSRDPTRFVPMFRLYKQCFRCFV